MRKSIRGLSEFHSRKCLEAASRPIYKAICRHFYRKVIQKHRRAIKAIAIKGHDCQGFRPRGMECIRWSIRLRKRLFSGDASGSGAIPTNSTKKPAVYLCGDGKIGLAKRSTQEFSFRPTIGDYGDENFFHGHKANVTHDWEIEMHLRHLAAACIGTFERNPGADARCGSNEMCGHNSGDHDRRPPCADLGVRIRVGFIDANDDNLASQTVAWVSTGRGMD